MLRAPRFALLLLFASCGGVVARAITRPLLVLSTLDGGVMGLDAATGSRVFALPGDADSPAVSSWAAPGRSRYIPGVNGRLFRLLGDGGAEEVDGVFLGGESSGGGRVGRKGAGGEVAVSGDVEDGLGVVLKQTRTSVLYVDAESGSVVKELDFESAGGVGAGGSGTAGMILLSRTEVGVRVLDVFSGAEVANATITHTTPSFVQGDVCVMASSIGDGAGAEWKGSVDFDLGIVSVSGEDGVVWSLRVEEDIIEAHGLGDVIVVRGEKVLEIGNGEASAVSVKGEGKVLYALPGPREGEAESHTGAGARKRKRKVGIAQLLGWREEGGRDEQRATDVGIIASPEEILLVRVQELMFRVVGVSIAAGVVIAMVILFLFRVFRRRGQRHEFDAVSFGPGSESRISTPSSAPLVTSKDFPLLLSDKFVLEGELHGAINGAESTGSGGSGSGIGVGVPVRSGSGWMTIGSFEVSSNVLGVGSHGTVVYEGRMMPGNRRVAVKRLLRQFYESARKEITLLVELDEASPHVVRYFAMEEDAEFIYLALELCSASLNTRVQSNDSPAPPKSYTTGILPRATVRALRQLVQGLADLHRQKIIHRDLKPQNVLCQGANLKLADVGLAMKLDADRSSYTAVSNAAGGVGTTGWRAPEVLSGGRQTRAVDVFSAGCIIYYVVTSGDHPFGSEIFGRDGNIVAGKPNLQSLTLLRAPEALDIVERMISPAPADRPSAFEALAHPFFWSDATKLAFLVDISDRLFDLRRDSMRYTERLDESPIAMKHCSDWPNRMDEELLGEIGFQYGGAASHLLRVVRNKRNHYSELSPRMQRLLGQLPDDEEKNSFDSIPLTGEKRQLDKHNYLGYFLSRVPHLLMCVYTHALNYPELVHQPHFARYGFNSSSSLDILPLHPRVARLRENTIAIPSPFVTRPMESCSPERSGELGKLPRCYYKRGSMIAISTESLQMSAASLTVATEAGIFSEDAGSRWHDRLTTGLYENYGDLPGSDLQAHIEEDENKDSFSSFAAFPLPISPRPSSMAMAPRPPPGFGKPPPGFSKPPAGFGRPSVFTSSPGKSPGRGTIVGFGSTIASAEVPSLGSRLDRKPALGYTAPGETSNRDWGDLRRGS